MRKPKAETCWMWWRYGRGFIDVSEVSWTRHRRPPESLARPKSEGRWLKVSIVPVVAKKRSAKK